MDNTFERGYAISRPKRIRAIVNYYGADSFKGKRILEVGAGYGDLGSVFARQYGAEVVCTDGRPEHVEKMKILHPEVEALVQDLEDDWPFDEKFDYIIHSGVLHHLRATSLDKALEDACQNCDNLILELEVVDREDPYYVWSVNEPDVDKTKSIYYEGNRPTTSYIERKLVELGMDFHRVMDDSLNGPAVFNWKPGHAPQGPRRFWFVSRKK